jgi:hypothetical protein
VAKGRFSGWSLPEGERARLLHRFPPAYSRTVADHVTLAFGSRPQRVPRVRRAHIVGIADDGAGVQALVVAIDGTTDRPDGATYHITWSLAPGRRPVESNAVIRAAGWRPVAPVEIVLQPQG